MGSIKSALLFRSQGVGGKTPPACSDGGLALQRQTSIWIATPSQALEWHLEGTSFLPPLSVLWAPLLQFAPWWNVGEKNQDWILQFTKQLHGSFPLGWKIKGCLWSRWTAAQVAAASLPQLCLCWQPWLSNQVYRTSQEIFIDWFLHHSHVHLVLNVGLLIGIILPRFLVLCKAVPM